MGDQKDENENENENENEEAPPELLPLELLQVDDPIQLKNVNRLLSHVPETVLFYLDKLVFPSVMEHRTTKLQASGVDLGSDMIFGTRLGFSGTPSDLLPRELRPCHYEQGSEAEIIRVLTSTKHVEFELIEIGWSVNSLLKNIAGGNKNNNKNNKTMKCPNNALIDTGAIVTGYSNEEVARSLLLYGLNGMDACVFVDGDDRRMLVDRTSAAPVPLDRSGVRIDKRFTFYDQVHTTGMDIKQALDATAVVTLGKDMTLRDYSQGCWRMRGLGKGQRIKMMVVKEVAELIRKNSTKMKYVSDVVAENVENVENVEDDDQEKKHLVQAVAWLITNSMRSEMLQYLQLQMQMITNLWRKSAFRTLMKSRSARQQDKYATATLTTRFHPKIVTEEELKENLNNIPDMLKDDILDNDQISELSLDYELLEQWYMTFLGGIQQRLAPMQIADMIAQMLPPRRLRDMQRSGLDHTRLKKFIHETFVVAIRNLGGQGKQIAQIFDQCIERADKKVKYTIDQREQSTS